MKKITELKSVDYPDKMNHIFIHIHFLFLLTYVNA